RIVKGEFTFFLPARGGGDRREGAILFSEFSQWRTGGKATAVLREKTPAALFGRLGRLPGALRQGQASEIKGKEEAPHEESHQTRRGPVHGPGADAPGGPSGPRRPGSGRGPGGGQPHPPAR